VAAGLLLAAAGGLLVAATAFWVWLGPRADLAAVATTARFAFKPVLMLALAGTSGLLLLRLARPGAPVRLFALAVAAVAVVLAVAVAIELIAVPSAAWPMRLIGTHWWICLLSIVLLSIPPLVGAFWAMERGAPTRPALCGAVTGLFAGGLGAALYTAHCTDDSPLFVALWYTLGIAVVVFIGAMLGRRLMRW
jgi:hypothetical protein